jgi:hypothetical protein
MSESNGLTLEERATNFETMKHIHMVQHFLHRVVHDLLERAEKHDLSKLEQPEVGLFTEYTPKLAGVTYGSEEYEEFRKKMGDALAHHYAYNRHHPEYRRRDEEWRPVVDFEGHYEVSNYGDVRSITRKVERRGLTGSLVKEGQLLHQYLTPKGYCRLQLQAEGKSRNVFVHVLVARAFIPNPDNKPEVNHEDGVKTNNHVSNLTWMTTSENLQHAYEAELKCANVKYVVTCEDLDITTFGCTKMVAELRKRGYEKASAGGIWRCINHGGKHLDLEFTGTRFEPWMNSPVNDMNLLDVVEMLCDWKAASMRHNDGNIHKSIELNADRFRLSPQLVKILENTVALFDE